MNLRKKSSPARVFNKPRHVPTGKKASPLAQPVTSAPHFIQPKLRVGAVNDPLEREADRMAETVMRMPDAKLQRQPDVDEEEEETVQAKPLTDQITPLVQRQEEPLEEEEEETIQAKAIPGQTPEIQRMCPECEEETVQRQEESPEEEDLEEDEELQAKSKPGETPAVTPNLESRISSMKSGGQPLDPTARAFFEPRFGHDFSQVRVHTDNVAADTAKSIHARAFTLGNHVVMGSGEYQPNSQTGQRLLGHELTHVVQQSNGIATRIQRQPKQQRFSSSRLPKFLTFLNRILKLLYGLNSNMKSNAFKVLGGVRYVTEASRLSPGLQQAYQAAQQFCRNRGNLALKFMGRRYLRRALCRGRPPTPTDLIVKIYIKGTGQDVGLTPQRGNKPLIQSLILRQKAQTYVTIIHEGIHQLAGTQWRAGSITGARRYLNRKILLPISTSTDEGTVQILTKQVLARIRKNSVWGRLLRGVSANHYAMKVKKVKRILKALGKNTSWLAKVYFGGARNDVDKIRDKQ